MRTLATIAIALVTLGSVHAQDPGTRDAYGRAVVALNVTFQHWDEDRPWARTRPSQRTASAVMVDETHLLTTAQMLDQATFIQLASFGRSRPYEPRVVYVDRSINLALLAIDDPAMREGLAPLPVAETTPTSGVVRTVRWTRQQLEIAASRVVRFEVEESWASHVEHAFVRLRTDLAGGGWADPVFSDGELVGLVVSQRDDTSRAIPAEILTLFLERAREPEPRDPFVALGVRWQVNRDASLTAWLGQEGEPTGMIVRQVPWGTTACDGLQPLDILLEIDGHPIDAEGHYADERFGRLAFGHLLAKRFRPGDPVEVRVLRDGDERSMTLTARPFPAELALVPTHRESAPPYAIVGGIVMRELDLPYLHTWGNEWSRRAPDALLQTYFYRRTSQGPDRRRRVLVTSVLPSEYTLGYEGLRDQFVAAVNGRAVDGIGDVLAALEHPQDGFHVIDLGPASYRGRVVLDAALLEPITRAVIDAYQVPEASRARDDALPPGGGVCPGSG